MARKTPLPIAFAGAVVWLAVGVPAFFYHASGGGADASWVPPFFAFGILFALDLVRPRFVWRAGESAIAIGLLLLRCQGYEAALLAVVAMQVGFRARRGPGVVFVAVQTLVLGVALVGTLTPRAALLMLPPYLGFELVAFFAASALARETTARAGLVAANAELRGIQDLLADASRNAERLRIAHELHDALGHRLTALSLNLEAALQRIDGPAKENVRTARALAGDLLRDVRTIVADYRSPEGVDLDRAIRALVAPVPRPKIHVQIPGGGRTADPERAHVLLRCAQEIVTNAVRHSGAENLWIVVDRDGPAWRILAHDDGRGGRGAEGGSGLNGMRERLERVGGELRIDADSGRGFGLVAVVPASPRPA